MASDEIHQSNIGTLLQVTILESGVARDVSAATVTYRIRKPQSRVLLEKTSSFVSDGTDGKTKYVLASGDLNEIGIYELQALVAFDETQFYTEISQFKVHKNL